MAQAHLLAIEHRTAAIDRPAIAVDPDDIDVGGANGDALLQDLRALVDHGIDAALQDLLVRDRPPLDSLPGREVEDDLLHELGGLGIAVLVVIVEAGTRLLAATILLAEDLAH